MAIAYAPSQLEGPRKGLNCFGCEFHLNYGKISFKRVGRMFRAQKKKTSGKVYQANIENVEYKWMITANLNQELIFFASMFKGQRRTRR